ncbi:MAG: redoxin domain-containing protein [Candidatus Obscuribacter phosphatis]|uniref:thioredoxin-dependent peroxiredoxin n=1 Tax=Candidatus Obscuribacter phosphatis TaxID=1906157 RepID=A0A8J7TLV7_9BACT|nr:redoxin domain-containing protein [Candidatus Obscuribacter phosphatis]
MLNETAPPFTLDATSGEKVVLSQLLGSFVVLIFYPANDTPTCNSQLAEMSMNTPEFLKLGAFVYGVNTASIAKSGEYCTRKRLNFPILHDNGGTVAKQYKAFTSWIGLNRRTVVVVDPQGRICFYEKGKPSAEKIIKCIEAHHAAL